MVKAAHEYVLYKGAFLWDASQVFLSFLTLEME